MKMCVRAYVRAHVSVPARVCPLVLCLSVRMRVRVLTKSLSLLVESMQKPELPQVIPLRPRYCPSTVHTKSLPPLQSHSSKACKNVRQRTRTDATSSARGRRY